MSNCQENSLLKNSILVKKAMYAKFKYTIMQIMEISKLQIENLDNIGQSDFTSNDIIRF